MRYISTRGGMPKISFRETVFEGLAPDGGLILPEKVPNLSSEDLKRLSNLSYQELALNVFKYFVDDLSEDTLYQIIKKAYASFRVKEITPVIRVGDLYILELFHGPTWAFKDVALQFLGELFETLLIETDRKINILGATSGDTGSAAIYGVRGKKNIAIFILHPYRRVSEIQALMMTTVTDPNVFNLAIEGTFDNCQAIVKELFMDLDFKKEYRLTAINSINWARVMAQMVYYFWAYFRVTEKENTQKVWFSVPTGNFGDIFAGYLARKMIGEERIEKLILATNENDILYRFVNYGDYSVGEVKPTISPSMDIQVASNFERYLYYLYREDPIKTKESMEKFKKEGKLKFNEKDIERIKKDFLSDRATEEEILKTIAWFYKEYKYVLDPHTAVGVKAALTFKESVPVVCLATAHPAKFPDTVSKALGLTYELPEELKELYKLPQRYDVLPASTERVREYIKHRAL